jgi:RNA polymerase sigma factor (sigma-70 family)
MYSQDSSTGDADFTDAASTPAPTYDFQGLVLGGGMGVYINFARRLTGGNDAQAEDLVQGALERAWKAWPRFKPISDDPAHCARAFMYRVIANLHNSQIKSDRLRVKREHVYYFHNCVPAATNVGRAPSIDFRKSQRALDESGYLSIALHEFVETFGTTSCLPAPVPACYQQSVFDRADIDELHQAIATLTPDHQEVLKLYYLEEIDAKSIADRLRMLEVTVGTRLFRARAALAKALGHVAYVRPKRRPGEVAAKAARDGRDEGGHTTRNAHTGGSR